STITGTKTARKTPSRSTAATRDQVPSTIYARPTQAPSPPISTPTSSPRRCFRPRRRTSGRWLSRRGRRSRTACGARRCTGASASSSTFRGKSLRRPHRGSPDRLTDSMSHVIHARTATGSPTASIERDTAIVDGFVRDAAHFPGGHADGVARPSSEADVAALVVSHGPILIAGAQSSLTGGATPHGGLVISTAKLTGIERGGADHVRLGAGVPLDTLQASLDEWGAWFPPVPTFMGAFAGGVVATNAAGAATFRYGTTRAWVDGLSCVLTCGCVLDVERGRTTANPHFEITCAHGTRHVAPGSYRMPDVPKVSAGYFAAPGMDLIDLFIGSEGTLAVITSVTFRVLPRKPLQALAVITSGDE